MFANEKLLVRNFTKFIKSGYSPWGKLKLAKEFFYQRGRTDIVALSEEGLIIAFEAKLAKWKKALEQAYRNRCFADLSYVLLPERSALNALKELEEFKRRGVGICYIDEDNIIILHDAYQEKPIQPWLKEKALMYVSGGC